MTGERWMVVDVQDSFLERIWGDLVTLVSRANKYVVLIDDKSYHLPLVNTTAHFGVELIVKLCRKWFFDSDGFEVWSGWDRVFDFGYHFVYLGVFGVRKVVFIIRLVNKVAKVVIRRSSFSDEEGLDVIFVIRDGFAVLVQSQECFGLGVCLAFPVSGF